MTETEPASTLASYALALLHGVTLEDFERQNLIELAAGVGVVVTRDMIKQRRQNDRADAQLVEERDTLRRMLAERRPWWKRLLGLR